MNSLMTRFLLPMLIVATGLPATSALTYYLITGDPSFRPFNLSVHTSSANHVEPSRAVILVRVDWGQHATGAPTQAELQRSLARSLSSYDVDFRLQFIPRNDDKILVTYVVDHNQVGPFQIGQAAHGIPAALAAFRIAQKP